MPTDEAVAREFYAAVLSGDEGRLRTLMHEEAACGMGGRSPLAGNRQGRDGLVNHFLALAPAPLRKCSTAALTSDAPERDDHKSWCGRH